MAQRLSICHQSSADKGTASAGAHIISTICDSTHEALVLTNKHVFMFFIYIYIFFWWWWWERRGGITTMFLWGLLFINQLVIVLMEEREDESLTHGVSPACVCLRACVCVFMCVCMCQTHIPVNPGHQYGNDYSSLGGRARQAWGPLLVATLSPDRGNAGIIRTGRVNGLSNTPLSDLPWARPTRMKDPATFFSLMVSLVISAAEVLQSGVISQG